MPLLNALYQSAFPPSKPSRASISVMQQDECSNTEVKQCDWLFVLVSVVCVDPALWAAASPGASCSVGHQVIHNPAKFKEAKCEAGEVM